MMNGGSVGSGGGGHDGGSMNGSGGGGGGHPNNQYHIGANNNSSGGDVSQPTRETGIIEKMLVCVFCGCAEMSLVQSLTVNFLFCPASTTPHNRPP